MHTYLVKYHYRGEDSHRVVRAPNAEHASAVVLIGTNLELWITDCIQLF